MDAEKRADRAVSDLCAALSELAAVKPSLAAAIADAAGKSALRVTGAAREAWAGSAPGHALTSAEREAREAQRQAYRRDEKRKAALDKLSRTLGAMYDEAATEIGRYEVYHEAQRPQLERIRAIADTMPRFLADRRNLVLYGTPGTGKDFLLAHLLFRAVHAGVSVDWCNLQRTFSGFRDGIKLKQPEWKILSRLLAPRVLGISDPVPAKGEPSEFNVSQLYLIVDGRSRDGLSTWITVNVPLPANDRPRTVKELEAHAQALLDHHLGITCWDRIQDRAEMVPCFWPSQRERRRRAY